MSKFEIEYDALCGIAECAEEDATRTIARNLAAVMMALKLNGVIK